MQTTRLQHYCHNCNSWIWDANIYLPNSKVVFPGHCGLYSAACVNAITDSNKTPPDFLSIDEVQWEVASGGQT